MKKIFSTIIISFIAFSLSAQSHISTQSHQLSVTAITPEKEINNLQGAYYSASDDGFVIRWTEDGQGEHYQFTDIGIKLLAVSPKGNQIAIYETDGGTNNKVSVWDWRTFTCVWKQKFTDSITSISYSAKGTYLIIGTATVDGAVFIRTSDWKKVNNKIKENTNIVSYIHTSDTEKTVSFYSPSGTLSFYDLNTGKVKQKIPLIKGLSSPVMYNKNSLFAGIKDNNIYITSKGKTIASIPASNPIILSNASDYYLYYLEYDGKNNYEIKMIESLEDGKVSNPRIIKTFRGPRGNNAINTGKKDTLNFYFGTRSGAIYKTEVEPSITTENLSPLTQNIYAKINDISPAEKDFYFLTENSVYKSSYDTGVVEKLTSTSGENKILTYKTNSVILYSDERNVPVKLVNFNTGASETLFTPKSNIQVLRICSSNGNDYLIEVESNGSVNMYDFFNSTYKEIYVGTGIQDAVLTNDNNIYIAKTASTNPQYPMLCINPTTMETVPLRIKGNVTYALSTDGDVIYGINVISDETGQNTYVFSFNVKTKVMSNMLKFAEEDPEAFTYIYGNNLFTNIGKNKVYRYNIPTKKRYPYNRSASVPKSICLNEKRAVILNNNGSISWCNTTDIKILADWYLTTDEQWFEF